MAFLSLAWSKTKHVLYSPPAHTQALFVYHFKGVNEHKCDLKTELHFEKSTVYYFRSRYFLFVCVCVCVV